MKPKWKQLNDRLVAEMRKRGTLRDKAVARAFLRTPRHLFAAETELTDAYEDRVVAVTRDLDGTAISSLSQPTIIAIMLQQLGLQPGHNVLEVGAGTGYNAALMAALVGEQGHVTTIDIDPDIAHHAHANLDRVGVKNVTVLAADGALGYAEHAPYDRIILTTSSWDIAPAWMQQLSDDGRLVLPLFITAQLQFSVAFDRSPHTLLKSTSHDAARFLTLRGSLQTPAMHDIYLDEALLLQDVIAHELAAPPDQIAAWLHHPPTHHSTAVVCDLGAIWYGLGMWLGTHLHPLHVLINRDAESPARYFLPLMRMERPAPAYWSYLKVEPDGMALLMRPAPDDDTASALVVLQYGAPTAAQKMLAAVHHWNDFQQVQEQHATIYVVGHQTPINVQPGVAQVPKPHVDLVVTWPRPT